MNFVLGKELLNSYKVVFKRGLEALSKNTTMIGLEMIIMLWLAMYEGKTS